MLRRVSSSASLASESQGSQGNADLLDPHWKPPREFIDKCLATGNVVPDERAPYSCSGFHNNLRGYAMGHRDRAARERWFEEMKQQLQSFKSWEKLDIHSVDADYAMQYGDHALGVAFPFEKLQPMLQKEKERMQSAYKEMLKNAAAEEPKAWQALCEGQALLSFPQGQKKSKQTLHQPCGSIEELYQGCLRCLPELWSKTEEIAEIGHSGDFSWSIKTLLRTNKKIAEKYDGQPWLCTDIVRSNIVCATLKDIVTCVSFALKHAKVVRLKNRFREPVLGYADTLLNLQHANGFISELQIHLSSIHYVKGTSGHHAFKWFRRLVNESDSYIGDQNDKGQRHGFGKWSGANGDTYAGQWKNDMKDGEGVYVEADGHKYTGGFKDDKREGYCTFVYFDGSQYEGNYKADKKHGHGVFQFADGQRYEGQWHCGKRHGKGSFKYSDGNTYTGEWQHHKRHGQGITTTGSGTAQSGTWREDQPVPACSLFGLRVMLCAETGQSQAP